MIPLHWHFLKKTAPATQCVQSLRSFSHPLGGTQCATGGTRGLQHQRLDAACNHCRCRQSSGASSASSNRQASDVPPLQSPVAGPSGDALARAVAAQSGAGAGRSGKVSTGGRGSGTQSRPLSDPDGSGNACRCPNCSALYSCAARGTAPRSVTHDSCLWQKQ